jgi:signal transduction histidine kinase/ligand-binding sensor domain-containing protein/DNA-binding response OmpR family regulator
MNSHITGNQCFAPWFSSLKVSLLYFLPILVYLHYLLPQTYAAGNVRFDILDTRHGLTNNNVTAIHEDKQGYLWFGTREGGVNRFNGTVFESFFHTLHGKGLTHNYVTSIIEDKEGLIWIGTREGINYFNPFTLEMGDLNSILNIISYLPSSIIHCLFRDSDDNIWIGSTSGLTRYAFTDKSFRTYHHNPEEKISLASNKIHAVTEFSAGKMLVGSDDGLDFLDVNEGLLENIFNGYIVRSLLVDSHGGIWVGTNKGLFQVSYEAGTFDIKKQACFLTPGNETITSLVEDVSGTIWLGTSNNGVVVINKEGEVINFFYPDSRNFHSVADRAINSLFIDNSHTVWVGTNSAGLNVYSPYSKPFNSIPQYRENIHYPGLCNFSFVDSKDRLWIATREGLHMYDKPSVQYHVFNLSENNNFINVAQLADGRIIAGTFGSGLYFFDENRKSFQRTGFTTIPNLLDQKIKSVMDDQSGNIWIGTIGNGVYRVNTLLNEVTHFKHDPDNDKTLANDFVKQIVMDKQGSIWFITNHQGVSKLAKGTDEFERYFHDPEEPGSLLNNSVDDIHLIKSGQLFFSTYDGLCTYSYETGEFEEIRFSKGNAPLGVKGLLEDNDGNWWISKKNGIVRYNPVTGESWEIDDIGIPYGEFKRSSIYMFSDGELSITGSYESVLFNPRQIRKNPVAPRLAFTNLFVNHEPVQDLHKNSVLQKPINLTEKIVLNPGQRNFNIEFTSLNIFTPGHTRFFYMLEGYDKNWVDAGNYKNATYTNLDPGNYTFRLRASNLDGVWSENDRVLQIIILPHWYATVYFRVGLIVSIITLVIVAVRYRINSLKRQRLSLKKKVEEKTRDLHLANEELTRQKQAILDSQETIVKKKDELEKANLLLLERNNEIVEKNRELEDQKMKLEELSQTKNRFFANISHEFKTPLTLILGPLENLMDRLKNEPDYLIYTELISKNSRRLLGLINQLLDISKIESGKMNLSLVQYDIIDFTHSIYNSFILRAERLNILYKFTTDDDKLEVYFDPDKVEKILFNLLSNAFKFTPTNGCIEVSVNAYFDKETGNKFARISVSDNGIGISTENLSKVFDYFNKIGQSNSGFQGSGIGLSLVKQMVEIHQGDVFITSKENEGTRVSVDIRVDEGMLENNVLQVDFERNEIFVDDIHYAPETKPHINGSEKEGHFIICEEAPYVLVIEDNHDILLYVKDILKDKYNVITATEGLRGYELAVNMIPDLVICDVMLPDSCGTDICKMIKNNEITNHIPVIVLTALGSEENMQRGLETGVDNYITKPFNPQMLKLRVNNLITTRKNLIEKHKINFLSNELHVMRSKNNEDFIEKLVSIIEENIEDPDFSNENIASRLNVSTRQLYRKLEGMLSIPLNKFIRHIKMKKAMEIMQSIPDLTISEIAYKVGFNDPKYFSKCFREEFGSLPSELLKAAKPVGYE